MPVELTPIPEEANVGNEKHMVLFDNSGRTHKVNLQLSMEMDESGNTYYVFIGFRFIAGCQVISAGKALASQANQLFPIDSEEVEMLSEIVNASIDQVRLEMQEEHPLLSKLLAPFFTCPSPGGTSTPIAVESIDQMYIYTLK